MGRQRIFQNWDINIQFENVWWKNSFFFFFCLADFFQLLKKNLLQLTESLRLNPRPVSIATAFSPEHHNCPVGQGPGGSRLSCSQPILEWAKKSSLDKSSIILKSHRKKDSNVDTKLLLRYSSRTHLCKMESYLQMPIMLPNHRFCNR